ncbi:hypothetical protein ACQPXH_33250 (plasmid) [Nocardia sp. CA-135953]|uniref:hypothetical protein n=1 Tax=Nocardia sp. CA-135953 TaxID=3239978 RepID=UPI003D97D815
MNQLFGIGAVLWFSGVGLILASRPLRRWKDSAFQIGIVLSVIGAPLLAIAVPSISDDPMWERVLYAIILVGWTALGILWLVAHRLFKAVQQEP